MSALTLSRQFFLEEAQPALCRDFPELEGRIAAGLVGNGSECFGYDDELSKDHDWGVDFYLWLEECDRPHIPVLQAWKKQLFALHPKLPVRRQSLYGAQVGVMTGEDFYHQLIGFAQGPSTIGEWRAVPQDNLALATNGEVFRDPTGQFSTVRRRLLEEFYPKDLWYKKIAARCMALAQTGQYNFQRCRSRRDYVTMGTVRTLFQREAIALVFLLNRTYKPYYKWEFRRMQTLPILGRELGTLLSRLATEQALERTALDRQQALMLEVCAALAGELRRQGLSRTGDWFLATHGQEVQQLITDPRLRAIPPQYE